MRHDATYSQKCEGRDLSGDVKKQGGKGSESSRKTRVDQEGASCARPFSIQRAIVAAVEGERVVLSVGPVVWSLSEGEASSLSDFTEGRLLEASRAESSAAELVVSADLETGGSVALRVSLDEAAVIVGEIQRALFDLEQSREGDPREDGDETGVFFGLGAVLS